ncbi:hypothetical protein [Nitrospina watsonii]|uniref:DUF3304 domain-containing protein n=1 Tax=Nitrospina watsonii TaxID=1323948 RepID=A0ABM9HG71_9BACT|nr:hypothetical protein [Nitrospina watsonii]CAI2719262.1 conserved protein of unknown function [Nitrospina watsonii]
MSGKSIDSKSLNLGRICKNAGGLGFHGEWRRRFYRCVVIGLLCWMTACTYRDPEIYTDIENVRAKPGTHTLAVAVKYLKWQWPNGLVTFPNPGVPKVLRQEARIYLVNADLPDDITQIVVAFDPKEFLNIAPWVLGWAEDGFYFQVTDPTVSGKENQPAPTQYFKWNDAAGLQQVDTVPFQLAFQPNTGPVPDGVFLRYSKGHDTVDVQTERHPEWIRNAFQVDPMTGHLLGTQG